MDFQPMSPEDMQRAMQFLLNQRAQFAADLPGWPKHKRRTRRA